MADPIFATFQTSAGDIVIKLFPEKAPKTVENFVKLVKAKTPVPVKKVAPAPKKSRAVKASVATPAPATPCTALTRRVASNTPPRPPCQRTR